MGRGNGGPGGQGHFEGHAIVIALRGDRSRLRFDQVLDDRQAQTAPAAGSLAGRVHAVEAIEDAVEFARAPGSCLNCGRR